MQLVELIAGDSPLDRNDLDGLAVDLPCLRRPRGRDGRRDVARYRQLPPALRAATIYFVLRAEVANGGDDQFVWNQLSILGETLEAFEHIGAHDTVGFYLELAEAAMVDTDESSDAVAAFMAFRQRLGGCGYEGNVDTVDEVGSALLRHAAAHPSEYVIAEVESQLWCDGAERFRGTLLRRPDGLYEVRIDKEVHHPAVFDRLDPQRLMRDAHDYWHELPRDSECSEELDGARRILVRERERRSVSPHELAFEVSVWSHNQVTMEARLWPTRSVPLDALPMNASLAIELRQGARTLQAAGHFVHDGYGRYGQIIMDTPAPDDADFCRGWQGTCRVLG